MHTPPMSSRARSFFEDVAMEFRSLAIKRGYDPHRGARASIYHDKVRFRLQGADNVVHSAIFVVSDAFVGQLMAYDVAERILDALASGYVVGNGVHPSRFTDRAALACPVAVAA